MTVVLVDPRRPSLVPVDAIELLTGDVQYTEEMPIKVPWSHDNTEADEVLFYVRGQFGSRKGVESGSITLHPQGIPHGPHPGTTLASMKADRTEAGAYDAVSGMTWDAVVDVSWQPDQVRSALAVACWRACSAACCRWRWLRASPPRTPPRPPWPRSTPTPSGSPTEQRTNISAGSKMLTSACPRYN